jgi:hypothetical protein
VAALGREYLVLSSYPWLRGRDVGDEKESEEQSTNHQRQDISTAPDEREALVHLLIRERSLQSLISYFLGSSFAFEMLKLATLHSFSLPLELDLTSFR